MSSRELALDEIVTEFMLNTCRPCPPSAGKHAVGLLQAAVCCCIVASPDDGDTECIPLTTGSVAEFYIEPILPHLGDIDVMFHFDNMLAIPRGHPPPTQLPAEFHNYVNVWEIIDSHLPGYVYLESRYLLTECSDNDNYYSVEYDRQQYLSNQIYGYHAKNVTNHGPAVLDQSPDESRWLSRDRVPCVRCMSWPPQAADWPTRHRNYGWPNSATLDRVVSNGCDVVGAVHRRCRQHKWMGKKQWRLSFSRAEIVLIKSWMPVQQTVYHMLRYFMKTERLPDCVDNSGAGTLSNYHIKTLMLWACELKPRSWWTDDVNLVRMCVQLLHILAKWLNDGSCQHYFINSCNLNDNSVNLTNIVHQLMSIDETWLSAWFVDNYIRACLQLSDCPQNISWLFDDVTTRTKLQNAVSALVAWRWNRSVLDLRNTFLIAANAVPLRLYSRPLTARSCVRWMTELAKFDSFSLSVYFTAIAFLHVASRSLRHGFNNELMDILAAVCGQFTDTRRHPNNSTSTSVLSLNKAAKLMKVVANKSLSTMSLIEIELSKAYLYRALRCKDSDSDSIYCLANVYLAVLYYTTGQYQTAIDHCTLVERSQDHSECSSVVQSEILPKIDDDVDNMLGLAELYQSVRTAALKHQRQPQLTSAFTTKLFAYYLRIKYVSATACGQFMQTSSADEFQRYEICISDTPQLFIGDMFLFLSISRLLNIQHKSTSLKPQCTPMNTNKYNSSELVELLQKSAVEHLTTYRQLVAQDFGSVAPIVTTDFEAMYAYKHGDYQRCLQLSTQNAHTLLYAHYMPDIPILPEFIQLLDDDIVSLTALMLMVNPQCRDDNEGRYICITQLPLSLYLMTQCQLKLHHSVTSLAQTLDYIEVAQRRHPAHRTLEQSTLKLIEGKVVAYVNTLLS